MAERQLPSPEVLRQLLHYVPETGKLFWRQRDVKWFVDDRARKLWNTRLAGREAFRTADSSGYLQGKIFDRRLIAHRVCWAMVTGSWPDDQIDHINGVRSDNRWRNLRQVTNRQNQMNICLPAHNTSGTVGVYFCRGEGCWRAKITVNGRTVELGRFGQFDDAVAARAAANYRFGFHPGHGKPRPA